MSRVDIAKTVEFSLFINTTNKSGELVWSDNHKVKLFKYKGNWRYRDGADTGSNIDFLINYYNFDFISAVNHILKAGGYDDKFDNRKENKKYKRAVQHQKKIEKIQEEEKIDFQAYIDEVNIKNNFGSYRYLVNIRKIDKEVFLWFYNKGLITRGERPSHSYDLSQDKSVKLDDTLTYFIYKSPLTSEITGLTGRENRDLMKFQGKKPFRKNFKGTEWGFGISKQKTITKMKLFEAPIDLLSYITIYKRTDKLNCYMTATGGANYSLIRKNVERLKDLEEIIMCYDDDDFGNDSFEKIKEMFPNLKVSREIPKKGCKDWNEMLTS